MTYEKLNVACITVPIIFARHVCRVIMTVLTGLWNPVTLLTLYSINLSLVHLPCSLRLPNRPLFLRYATCSSHFIRFALMTLIIFRAQDILDVLRKSDNINLMKTTRRLVNFLYITAVYRYLIFIINIKMSITFTSNWFIDNIYGFDST